MAILSLDRWLVGGGDSTGTRLWVGHPRLDVLLIAAVIGFLAGVMLGVG